MVVRQSYTLHSVPIDISSTPLAPYIAITIYLTIFSTFYFTSSWLFCNYWLVLLLPSIFPPFLHPLLYGNPRFFLCINAGGLRFWCLTADSFHAPPTPQLFCHTSGKADKRTPVPYWPGYKYWLAHEPRSSPNP